MHKIEGDNENVEMMVQVCLALFIHVVHPFAMHGEGKREGKDASDPDKVSFDCLLGDEMGFIFQRLE